DTIRHLRARVSKLMQLVLMRKKESIQSLRKSYAFHYPKQLLQEKEQYVDRMADKLSNRYHSLFIDKKTHYTHLNTRLQTQHPKRNIQLASDNLSDVRKRYDKNMDTILRQKQQALYSVIDKLTLLNPLHIMKRGFALPHLKDGTIIKSVNQLTKSDDVSVKIKDGS